ncbi:MAG TPA: NAD(P)-binding domain-containing protein [Dehalococcoidia bacterium]|nr:NAD(P)-binding domain-containing protein [Dehalococcoidia bacterium]
MKKLGFIGCGTMGKPMALNLIKAGYSITAYDLNPEPVKELEAAGATASQSPREVAEQANIIITMLPSSPDVEQVLCGPRGILENPQRGTIIIDMTTGDPMVSRRLAALAAERG